jgi:hypothetical protein
MLRWSRLALAVCAFTALLAPSIAHTAPTAPAGATAFALDGRVALAWKASSGATSYKVLRGTSATAVTTQVGTSTSTSFTDTTAVNGTTYFYAVQSSDASGDSPASTPAQARPVARGCSTGNAVVLENCYPGSPSWQAIGAGPASSTGGIEGFATATSVNVGNSVDLKVNASDNAPYHIDVYRMGYYGGAHGRLVSSLPGLRGVRQPGCQDGPGNTGLVDCSNWATTSTLTTSASWPSGVYMLHLIRDDGLGDNEILLTVRDDSSRSDLLYTVPISTYQAYNNYGGKSLYDFNSSGAVTVAGTTRAVKVSYDRPYSQTYTTEQNWFGFVDVANVGFLEEQGYDVSYDTSTDLHAGGALVANHAVYVSAAHDEYWSAEMRSAVTSARNAGTSLFFLGSNQIYWKIRFEASPFSGAANRVEVAYKTTQGGATDPVSPTGTWRDPAGANQPENALVGQMYIGDNDSRSFPMVVTAAQGKSPVWRHTDLANLAAGTSATLGSRLVGWEWNDRVANGLEPAGVQTFSSSPVTGELIQGNGASYLANQSATVTSTIYQAPSGADVVSTGTNQWSRGLDLDGNGSGEPNAAIQQATVNILADMNARPATPSTGIVVDGAPAPLAVTGRSPAAQATGVAPSTLVRATFSRAVDPTTVTPQTFTVSPPGGGAVAATVSYDATTTTATLTPSAPLALGTTYTVRVATGVKAADGSALPSDVTWTFATASSPPAAPTVSATSPADGAGAVTPTANVTATFDRAMDATTLTGQSFVLRDAGGTAVAASISYDATSRTATLKPTATLAVGKGYTAQLTTAVRSADGTPLASAVSWSFTTADCPCSLMPDSLVPQTTGLDVQDGRTGAGPFSYELGTKITVDRAMRLTALRFYKDAGETGTHVGRVWSAAGTQLASVTFAGETASGWQQASLDTPLSLTAATTYVVSVGLNARFAMTDSGLSAALTNGPLHSVADGLNGVFGNAAGTFPTQSWHSSNYFVDAVVANPTATSTPPQVTARSPVDGATNVDPATSVTATFASAMNASTINGSSFVLQTAAGNAVTASVTYDATSRTATLKPASALAAGASYTARLTTAVQSSDGTPLPAAVTWTFSTAAPAAAPTVTSTSPAAGATSVGASQPVQATFSTAMDPATITSTTFTLRRATGAVAGAVSYDATTRTATLAPSSALAAGTTYTATVTTGVKSSSGQAMGAARTWTFTTASCPCQLMPSTLRPTVANALVRDGRPAPGPWTYELGTKITVSSPVSLTAIRFYKGTGETGTHVGRLWAAAGQQVASVTFRLETATGWQQASLATPVSLTPGVTYVVSVGVNTRFVTTSGGLRTQLSNGPLASVADGLNGVFANAAGVFPTGSWQSSNYFVDAVVR